MKKIELKLETDYISQDKELCNELNKIIKDNQIVLLIAPQGTGKTRFLKSLMKQYQTLLASPTISLAEQNERDFRLKQARGRTPYTFEWSQSYNFNEQIENSSTTFGSAEGFLQFGDLESFDLIVADEIHKLVQYSTFTYSNVESIVKTLNHAVDMRKKVLLITATPDLVPCLKGFNFKTEIDVAIYIDKEKKYFEKCICMYNLDQNRTLINQIKMNHRVGKFQLVLFNSGEGIKKIAEELNSLHISAIKCTSDDYRNDEKIRSIVQDIKIGNYQGYSVLLTTSWIDVGLNFTGDNISYMYCVFDRFYKRGDFTIIRQFMARARNSNPILYINHPCLTKEEKKLQTRYDLKNQDNNLFKDLKELAMYVLDKHDRGLIQSNVDYTTMFYGLYVKEECNNLQDCIYAYSDLTLRYQILKLSEKAQVDEFGMVGVARLLGVDYNSVVETNEMSEYYESIQNLLDEWYREGKRFSNDELCGVIKELSYGLLNYSRPSAYVERNYGYTIGRSNRTRYLVKQQ